MSRLQVPETLNPRQFVNWQSEERPENKTHRKGLQLFPRTSGFYGHKGFMARGFGFKCWDLKPETISLKP